MSDLSVFFSNVNQGDGLRVKYENAWWLAIHENILDETKLRTLIWSLSPESGSAEFRYRSSHAHAIITEDFENRPIRVLKVAYHANGILNRLNIIESLIDNYPLFFHAHLQLYDLYDKHAVLKAVLSKYKLSYGKQSFIKELQEFGIDYPEFKAIEKSMNSK